LGAQASLRAVDEWCAVLTPSSSDTQTKKPISLLLANKTDIGPRVATESAIERFARDSGFEAYSLGSAKEGTGVKTALDRHVEAIVTANGVARPAGGAVRRRPGGAKGGEEIAYNVPSPLLPHAAWEAASAAAEREDTVHPDDAGWMARFWEGYETRLSAHKATFASSPEPPITV